MSQFVYDEEANKVAGFVGNLQEVVGQAHATFDSASSDSIFGEMLSRGDIPEKLQVLLDESKGETGAVLAKTILDSVELYTKAHGREPTPDLLNQAIHSAYATTHQARTQYKLDSASATTEHHDQMGIVNPRPIVSILTTMGSAIPVAYYLPSDIGNNKATLAIVSNRTANDYGSYAYNDSLDGTNSGNTYVNSARVHQADSEDQKAYAGKITTLQGYQGNEDQCNPEGKTVKLLRGRSLVYINGKLCGREIDSKGVGDSSLSGTFHKGSTAHQISGKINTDNGVFTVNVTPALGENDKVLVEAFIDYERSSELTPSILTAVETFDLHANAWRVLTSQTIDSRTQMSNELGLDPYSQQVVTVNAQFGNERHYDVLKKARRMAQSNQKEYTFNFNPADHVNSRVGLMQAVSEASHDMLLRTQNFGIGTMYVNKKLASLMRALPTDIFQSSGLPESAGIYRVGTLFGIYDVYFTPKVVRDGEILCIGRATDVARSPFVLGDAVPATVIPLAVDGNLKSGVGFYARNFTSVNPYAPSNEGCSIINVSFTTSV